nr:MAG TPA: hypothetical protein [Caudoviricetes sp.]
MPNPENLRTPTSEEAREMQKKSAAKRKQNTIEKKVIKEILEKRLKIRDLEEMLDNLIERAKEDSRDFEVLQASLGQKPIDRIQVAEVDAETIKNIESMFNDDFE